MKTFTHYPYRNKTFQNYLSKAFILLCLFAYNVSYGQGLVLDKKKYKETPLVKITKTRGKIVEKCFEELKNYAPTPLTQGAIPSCVGWSLANAFTIYFAYRNLPPNRKTINQYRYSSAFIYNQIKLDGICKNGASITDGLKLLATKGVCLKSTFDYGRNVSCDVQPPNTAKTEALNYRLKTSYKRVFNTRKNAHKIRNTKVQVMGGNPVIVGFSAVPKNSLRGQAVWYPDQHSSRGLGHAMVVVGYDDEHFTLMNSYGPSWGQKGFIKIRNEDYIKYAQEAYVLDFISDKSLEDTIQFNAHVPVEMSSQVSFKSKPDTSHTFKASPILFDSLSQVYNIVDAKDINDKPIQLEVFLPLGTYVYVFAIEKNGDVYPLWNMDAIHQDTTLHIPSDNSTFSFENSQGDYLCILYSYVALENYTPLEKLPTQHSTIYETLKQQWPMLIDKSHIAYATSKAQFTSNATYKDGYIVPIIYRIDMSQP